VARAQGRAGKGNRGHADGSVRSKIFLAERTGVRSGRLGAFTAVGGPDSLGWHSFAAVAVGTGTSLVLDEFALDFNRRWAPVQTRWEDFVGGRPSQPNPPASEDVHR
jgi:hypothetical protein